MNERIETELAMLRACWPSLEFVEAGHWLLIPSQRLLDGLWDHAEVEIATQIPPQIPGQAPYGFYVRPGLLTAAGQAPANYTYPSDEPPFPGGSWGKFSWTPVCWAPQASATAGDNMVSFMHSIAERLREGS
jgi:hypothetical protein